MAVYQLQNKLVRQPLFRTKQFKVLCYITRKMVIKSKRNSNLTLMNKFQDKKKIKIE